MVSHRAVPDSTVRVVSIRLQTKESRRTEGGSTHLKPFDHSDCYCILGEIYKPDPTADDVHGPTMTDVSTIGYAATFACAQLRQKTYWKK